MTVSAATRAAVRCGLAAACLLVAGPRLQTLPAAEPADAARQADPPASDDRAAAAAAERQQLITQFQQLLTGATLTGSFTIDRDDIDRDNDEAAAKPPREESYEISSATPLGGDLWLVTSRIRYGDVDATVPVPVAVKWAGSTPVITLDQVTIPGMGTFSARVLFHGDRYAGTWQHDDVGGHMFGRVTPAPASAE